MSALAWVALAFVALPVAAFFWGRRREGAFRSLPLHEVTRHEGRLSERLAVLDIIEASYAENPTPQTRAIWESVKDRSTDPADYQDGGP